MVRLSKPSDPMNLTRIAIAALLTALAFLAFAPAPTGATTIMCEVETHEEYAEAGCSAHDVYNGIGAGTCTTVATNLDPENYPWQYSCVPPGF